MYMSKSNVNPNELLNKQIAQATYDGATMRLVSNLSEVHSVLVVAESHGIDVFSANRALVDIMSNVVSLVNSAKKLVD
jgi:hypothetical protein